MDDRVFRVGDKITTIPYNDDENTFLRGTIDGFNNTFHNKPIRITSIYVGSACSEDGRPKCKYFNNPCPGQIQGCNCYNQDTGYMCFGYSSGYVMRLVGIGTIFDSFSTWWTECKLQKVRLGIEDLKKVMVRLNESD